MKEVVKKERTKTGCDKHIIKEEFKEEDQVLFFNSRLKLFIEKLKSKWSGPFLVKQVFPHGVIEVGVRRLEHSRLIGKDSNSTLTMRVFQQVPHMYFSMTFDLIRGKSN